MRRFLLFACGLLVSCAKPLPGGPWVDRHESVSMDVYQVAELVGQSRPEVRSLTIGGCGTLHDLTALRAFENLDTLQLGSDACLEVESTAGVEALPHLHGVWLGGATVGDLAPLQRAPALRQLFIERGRASVSGLEGLTLDALKIDLTAAPDAELDALVKLPHFSRLSMLGLTARRMPTLPFMPSLKQLIVALQQPGTDAPLIDSLDLSFAFHTPSLDYLDLSGALHADLEPLRSLPMLKQLFVAGICDLDPRILERLTTVQNFSVSPRLDERVFPPKPGVNIGRTSATPCTRVAPPLLVPTQD